MNITFIGNCQTLSLCFFFQELLHQNNNIYWILYGEDFKQHIGVWSEKCKNKILDYDNSIQKIKDSDIIVYQTIDEAKSLFSNTKTLNEIKKGSCKLIQIPSIHLIYNDFDNSIKELINRETANNVDIKVSTIFNNFKEHNLMLSCWHPNTFLFMEIVKILCNLLNISFFTKDKYFYFLKNKNFMELP
jgi:hypothetical protein